jgi:hypothetical protein
VFDPVELADVRKGEVVEAFARSLYARRTIDGIYVDLFIKPNASPVAREQNRKDARPKT